MAWRKPKNLREWLGILKRHKKKFFFPAVVTMIAVAVASHWVPREYMGEAKFERKLDIAMSDGKKADITVKQVERQRRFVFQHIRGRAAIEQLIDDMGLTKGMPRVNGELTAAGQLKKLDLVRDLTSRIGVKFEIKDSSDEVIAVTMTSSDQEQAPKLANRLVENYIRKTKQDMNEQLKGALVFFQKEVVRFSARVRELESKKLRFEMDHRGLLPDDPQSVQTKMVELRSQAAQVNKEMRLAAANREALSTWVKEQPEFVTQKRSGPNPILEELRVKFRRLETDLEEQQRLGRTPEHPAVKKITKLVDAVKAEIAETPAMVDLGEDIFPNKDRLQAEKELSALSGQLKELERQRDELQGQTEHYETLNRNFFVVRNDYLKILNDLEEAQGQLKFWVDRERKTRVAVTQEIQEHGVRLRFIQHAPAMTRPSKPTPVMIAGAAIVLGLGVGALMIVLAELLDRSFHNVEQAVDELKLPVLGSINEIVTPAKALRRKIMGWGVYPAVGLAMVLVLAGVFGAAYLSLQRPHDYKVMQDDPIGFIEKAITGH